MGKCRDILTSSERLTIFESLLHSAGRGVEKSDGAGRHWASCPFHTEKTPSFFYNPENDYAKCFGCGAETDLIGVANGLKGLPADDVGGFVEFRDTYLGGPDSSFASKPKKEKTFRPRWVAKTQAAPPELWQRKAGEFAEECCEILLSPRCAEQRQRLLSWGINTDTIREKRIGWNPAKAFRPVTAWGLPYEENKTGKERCILLPTGFVFPCQWEGAMVRMQIRVDNTEEFQWENPDEVPKYWEIVGGWKDLFIFGQRDAREWEIVETVRDGMLLSQELAERGVGAMAVGGASNQPGSISHAILSAADFIGCSLDSDNAGAKASLHYEPFAAGRRFAWLNEYPQAVRIPVPSAIGKDVGDLPSAGVSVWDWFSAGLPDHILRRLEIRRDALARDGGAVGEAEAGAEAGAENSSAADQAQGVNQGGEAVNQTAAPVSQIGEGVAQKAQAPKKWEAPRAGRGVKYLPMPEADRVGDPAYEDYSQRLAESGSALLLEVQAGKIRKAVWPLNAPKVRGIEEGFNIMLRNDSEVTARIEKALKEAA